jgi:hypothetical protein
MTALTGLIQEQKRTSFTNPDKATDTDALGILIAHHFEWDGIKIMETFFSALEDANFHTEAEQVLVMLESLKIA